MAMACSHRGLLAVMCSGLAALGACHGAEGANAPVRDETIAMVDGASIAREEFEIELDFQRAAVIDRFRQRGDTTPDPQFWSTSYGGLTPAVVLRERALAESIRRKSQQLELRRAGIAREIDFASLDRRWSEENQRRDAAIRNGERVYGPIHIERAQFAIYELTNQILSYKRWAADTVLRPSDAELRAYYEKTKSRFGSPGEAEMIEIPYGAPLTKPQARALAESTRQRLRSGGSLTADARIRRVGVPRIRPNAPLGSSSACSTTAPVGEIVERQHSFAISVCAEAAPASFEQVRLQVRTLVMDEKYELLVNALVRKARVEVRFPWMLDVVVLNKVLGR